VTVRIAEEVSAALASGDAIVALESTIFSSLGLPAPDNRIVLAECIAAIRDVGATPAVCAVIDGVATIGTSDHERVLGATTKLGERDLPAAMATGATGVTTVSATVALAAHAGIEVFATGGIGGVHRGVEHTGDISADLLAIARHSVVTVSAGVKGFLDVGRTVEYLETLGVPVLGWQTEEFPAFWCRTSGFEVGQRVDDTDTVARAVRSARQLGNPTGFLLAVPCPESVAIADDELAPVIATALRDADRSGVSAGAVTPFVLDRILVATAGRSVVANRALAVQNAQIAARVARSLVATSL
jgi:pseudouridylate synthase